MLMSESGGDNHWGKDAALNHPKQKVDCGCVYKHVAKLEVKENAWYPACAYRYNSVEETKSVEKKKALYELDPDAPIKGSWRDPKNHKVRITVADRLKGKSFSEQSGRGRKKKDSERDVFTPRNPAEPGERGAWNFGVGRNYTGELRPFKHEHHHIMPEESVFDVLERAEERDILQVDVGYNINSRMNMIILPCASDVAEVLGLPVHRGRHGRDTEYAKSCIRELNKIKQQLEKIKDEGCNMKKAEVSSQLKKSLERWQQRQYWRLVMWGRSNARSGTAAHINSFSDAVRV
ncbi:AHH domain-containing protein [Melittangium boletus]|uniref:AHH domain-containing protein n=1 Tax=Melittangium boletus TaxID=83453 RepID=UPI003DA34910